MTLLPSQRHSFLAGAMRGGGGGGGGSGGARGNIVVVIFFWVVLVLVVFCHEALAGREMRSPPTKARFYAPSSSPSHHVHRQSQITGFFNGDPDKLYGEDKRIVHTGPNPLHN